LDRGKVELPCQEKVSLAEKQTLIGKRDAFFGEE